MELALTSLLEGTLLSQMRLPGMTEQVLTNLQADLLKRQILNRSTNRFTNIFYSGFIWHITR